MKKIYSLFAVLTVITAMNFIGCSGVSDSSDDSGKNPPKQESSGTSLAITYTSVKPDDANTSVGGWIDLQKEYYTLDGSEYYPKDVPSKKTVTATSKEEGYSESYVLTAEDLPELSHKYLTFAGWYSENGEKREVGDSIFADTTLNAVWKDGKTTGSIVYKRTDEVNTSANNILGSAYTYSGNYNKSFGIPVGILIQSKYYLADTNSYFIMNLNESSEKLSWATENSEAATKLYNELMSNGVSSDSYGSRAYSYFQNDASIVPAIEYCNSLSDNGLKWFLPSLGEINGISSNQNLQTINNTLKNLKKNGISAIELTDGTEGIYWTSSVAPIDGTLAHGWNLYKDRYEKIKKIERHFVRAFAEVDENFAKSTL